MGMSHLSTVNAPVDQLTNDQLALGQIESPSDEGEVRVPMLSGQPHMLFQDHYVWFVLLASLDIMLTWVVLTLGGQEVNVLADSILQHRGLPGLIVYKFALVVFVVVMCEQVGRKRRKTGRSLAEWSIAISTIPLVVALVQIALWSWVRLGQPWFW